MENNQNSTPHPMETTISAFFSSIQPRKEFMDDLAMKLHFQYLEQKSTSIEIEYKKENWFNIFRRKIQARPVLLILSILIAMLVLTGVVYAVGRLSGYIPGFGFANSKQEIYVLEEEFEIQEQGLLIKFKQAISDEERFWVELQVYNLVELPVLYSTYIFLSDGHRLENETGGYSFNEGIATFNSSFSALPTNTQNLTFILENLTDEPIRIPLKLRPIKDGEMLSVAEVGEYPKFSPKLNGIQLSLDYVAPASDRTVFQVSIHFDQDGTFIIGPWTISLQDKNGMVYPLTEITPSNTDRNKSALFQTTTFEGNEELILSLRNDFPMENKIRILQDYSPNPGKFMFDPGENPQPGQVWELDEQVQVGEFTLQVVRAELLEGNEFAFEFAPNLNVIEVMLYSDEPDFHSTSSRSPVENQNFSSTIGFQQLPKEPFEIQIRSIYQTIAGDWQIDWTPPTAPLISTNQLFPTTTPPTIITPNPTFEIEDDLYQRVKTLSDQFDAPFQQGPGWVHVVKEQHSKVEEGQLIPPAYYKTSEWYEVDADGYIQRTLYTEFRENGTILQQSATIGNFSINLTFGSSGYNEMEPRRFSLDRLKESFLHADEYKSEIIGEEVDCQDGKRCLLVRVKDILEQPVQESSSEKAISGTVLKVWIDLETGLQFKFESTYLYEDGSEEVRTKREVLLIEKVEQVPAEVVGILDRVVMP